MVNAVNLSLCGEILSSSVVVTVGVPVGDHLLTSKELIRFYQESDRRLQRAAALPTPGLIALPVGFVNGLTSQ